MTNEISIMKSFEPYPFGPRTEAEALKAAKEVGPDGFITGGPYTPAEWLHWNGAHEAGWGGRWPQPLGDSGFFHTPLSLMPSKE